MSDNKTHNLYVIALDTGIANWNKCGEKFAGQNPEYKPGSPCLYVGMTANSPEERFNQHKTGYKASWAPKRFGICLRRKLFEHLNPMTREEAETMEVKLADELREQGYGVWQN